MQCTRFCFEREEGAGLRALCSHDCSSCLGRFDATLAAPCVRLMRPSTRLGETSLVAKTLETVCFGGSPPRCFGCTGDHVLTVGCESEPVALGGQVMLGLERRCKWSAKSSAWRKMAEYVASFLVTHAVRAARVAMAPAVRAASSARPSGKGCASSD